MTRVDRTVAGSHACPNPGSFSAARDEDWTCACGAIWRWDQSWQKVAAHAPTECRHLFEDTTTGKCSHCGIPQPQGPTRVTVHYFKRTGKWYCDDEDVEWPRDPEHYTGWATLRSLHRIEDMYAVCLENPLGFPQFSHPKVGT